MTQNSFLTTTKGKPSKNKVFSAVALSSDRQRADQSNGYGEPNSVLVVGRREPALVYVRPDGDDYAEVGAVYEDNGKDAIA